MLILDRILPLTSLERKFKESMYLFNLSCNIVLEIMLWILVIIYKNLRHCSTSVPIFEMLLQWISKLLLSEYIKSNMVMGTVC